MSEKLLGLHEVRGVLTDRWQVTVPSVELSPGSVVAVPADAEIAGPLGDLMAGRGLGWVEGGSLRLAGADLLSMTLEERIRRGLFVPQPIPGALSEAEAFRDLQAVIDGVRRLQGRSTLPTLLALQRSGMDRVFQVLGDHPRPVGEDVMSVLVQALLAEAPVTVLALTASLNERARSLLQELVVGLGEERSLLVLGDVEAIELELGDHARVGPVETGPWLAEAV